MTKYLDLANSKLMQGKSSDHLISLREIVEAIRTGVLSEDEAFYILVDHFEVKQGDGES